jgi:uncharacterized protein
MEPVFNEARLLQHLEGLHPQSGLAFALSCAERLYPNYLAFVRAHAWGDSEAVRQALDLAWRALGPSPISAEERDTLLARCEAAAPDTEEFASGHVSAALDAACAACLLLEFLRDGDAGLVAQLAALCRDTVDMYVQELEQLAPPDPNLEERIHTHRLMQQELARQRADLALLREPPVAAEQLSALMSRWRAPQVSNIGLPG